jgi:hypothetical protein
VKAVGGIQKIGVDYVPSIERIQECCSGIKKEHRAVIAKGFRVLNYELPLIEPNSNTFGFIARTENFESAFRSSVSSGAAFRLLNAHAMSNEFDQGRSFTVIFEGVRQGWRLNRLSCDVPRVSKSPACGDKITDIMQVNNHVQMRAFGVK